MFIFERLEELRITRAEWDTVLRGQLCNLCIKWGVPGIKSVRFLGPVRLVSLPNKIGEGPDISPLCQFYQGILWALLWGSRLRLRILDAFLPKFSLSLGLQLTNQVGPSTRGTRRGEWCAKRPQWIVISEMKQRKNECLRRPYTRPLRLVWTSFLLQDFGWSGGGLCRS